MGEITDSNPCGIFKMKGDGNCYFRAVSYALVGDQEQHQITRQIIAEWMTKNEVQIDNHFGSEYLNESHMEEDGMWATEAEILATAALLNTDLQIYCESGKSLKWLRYKSSVLGKLSKTKKCIFLDNSSGNHFNYVTFIE